MSKKFMKGMAGLLLMLSIVACGHGQKKSEMKSNGVDTSLFPEVWESKEKEIKGGTYKIALINGQPFKGVLNSLLWTDNIDSDLVRYFEPNLFEQDINFDINDKGLAKIDINTDEKTVTITLKDNLKWDDGEPMTIDDYIFSYEVLGHPDYTGVRYNAGVANVVGMEEYHAGKAKSISGLEKLSDTSVKIHFKEMSPSMKKGLGGINSSILPKHQLKDIPVAKLEQSDEVRLHPVGAGPFKVVKIIPGESIEYAINEHYYKPEELPKFDKLIVKILPESSSVSSMKNGEFDEYLEITESVYQGYKDFDNIQTLGRPALYYQYLGFNLGHYDNKKGENVVDPDAKLADIELRKAIAYAMDIEPVTKSFYNGLRIKANSPIPPVFKDVYDPTPRYDYNPEKAKEILDKAGYKDVDGDGYREDKNGKPLEIFFEVAANAEIHEPMAQHFMQNWQKVGLKVSLTGGRLMDPQSFFDRLSANDKAVDMWIAAWGIGTALDLNESYGRKSLFNFARITSDKNEELLYKISSLQSLKDPEFRVNAIKEWNQNYMDNILGFLPLTYKYELFPINKRVKFKSVSVDPSISEGKRMGIVSEKSYVSSK